jgi:hypothetical protein
MNIFIRIQLLKVHMSRLSNHDVEDEEKTVDQIVQSMQKSMIGYEVLGTPEGRLWRLREIASCILARLKQDDSQ